MMVFNVCVNINFLVEELVICFDLSCDSHHCCVDCWLSVYYNGTQHIL